MGWFSGSNNKVKEEAKKTQRRVEQPTRNYEKQVIQQRSASQVPSSVVSHPSANVANSGAASLSSVPPVSIRPQDPREENSLAINSAAAAAAAKETLVMVERPPTGQRYDEEHAASRSYSHEEESAPEANAYAEASRQNHLNSLFNGHLMKWKFEAEEGSAFVRVPAFFGALGLIGTLIAAMVTRDDAYTSHAIVMGVCVAIMSLFTLILDGRFLLSNPLSTRAHLRNIITRNFNMFRFVWGRGILYIMAGTLNIAQMWLLTMISGAYMIFVGFIAIIVGVHASRKFAALRNSLSDESFLLLVFSNYDSDGDGYLAPSEFAHLLADLGMELDDRYTLKAFNVIDTDSDRRISFDEFNHWWTSGYIERGRKRYHGDDDDDESYRRME